MSYCAHNRVVHERNESAGGTVYGESWRCDGCGTYFAPRPTSKLPSAPSPAEETAGTVCYHCGPIDKCECVAAPIAPAAQDESQNLRYAKQIAEYMAKNFYPDVPQWKALGGDLFGLLSQIDNMATGLMRKPSAEGDGWIAELRCGLELVAHALADENVEHVAPWTRMRKWLNQRDVYNGDLQEHRVTLEVVKILLALLSAPPSGQGEKR